MKLSFLAILLLASFASPLSANQQSNGVHGTESYVNITTSPFERIMNVLITTPDAVYSTPALLIVGTDKQLLRCLHEDPDECEVLYNSDTYIHSFAISGEYVYCGLYSNIILRCNLYQKESCSNYKSVGSSVESLTIAGGYLYAGLYNNNVMRCQLVEPYNCETFHVLEKPVYSLAHSDGHIYAGLWDGKLMRCSLTTKNSCTPVFTMSAGIMGISNVRDNILAVTWDALFWNCSRKSDAAIDCVSAPLNYTTPREVAFFNGDVFTVQNGAGIWKCKQVNSIECSKYGNIKKAYSVAFVYGTFRMQSRYRKEESTFTWQSSSKCPPFVTYYDAQQRASLEVYVKEGKLHNSLGQLVDTSDADEGGAGPAAIFVMGPDGKLLLSNSHKKYLLHTSSLLAGNPVSGAGEIVVNNGTIQKIRACSEHYRPDTNLNRQVIQSLQVQGYTENIDSQMCGEDKYDNEQSDMNNVQ